MYTSGCPKSQNRCCQSTGSPPAAGTKKFAPKKRSSISSVTATVMMGKASTSSTMVTRLIHVNSGIRMRVMPGARMLTMVTKKLNAAASEAIPSTWMPSIQNSVRTPAARSVMLAYMNQPESGTSPIRKLVFMSTAPNRKVQ